MYKRDFAVVLLACVAILVAIQHEGTFSFRKAWYHDIYDETQDLIVQHHMLPPPVVADLNGDGHLELITATPDLKLQVVEPKAAGRQGDGFAKAKPLNEVSLLFKRTLVAAGRRPVALAVGYIDALPRERGVRPLRKQVVVVVTASWQVLCFDHNLKLMWEKDVMSKFPHHSHIKEVAVYVSPHIAQQDDRGLIVVGASVERGDLASGEGLESAGGGGKDKEVKYFGDGDVLLEELRLEEEHKARAHSAGMAEKLSDLDASEPEGLKGVGGVHRHFDYIALEGGSGADRWHHGSDDFHKDLQDLQNQVTPQNNYRLDAEKLEGRHFGEASCRDYRESVLHVLPHVWDRPTDTRIVEAHFVKHKEGRGAQKHTLHTLAHAGKRGHKAHHGPPGHHAKTQPPHNTLFKGLFGKPPHHTPLPPFQHGHGRGGVHVHPPRHHSNLTANALVAFLEEGIEVLHLYSGRTICKLHLPSGALHADLNGDGVLDHVSVYHGHAQEADEYDLLPDELPVADTRKHRAHHHCQALATSGVPAVEEMWQVDVCRTHKFGVHAGIFERAQAEAKAAELLTPIMLPVPDLAHGYRSHRKQHGIVVFANSKGEVTAVNAKGEHLWQSYFPTTWPPAEVNERNVVPTLMALPLRTHAVPSAILVAGETEVVIVSEHGNTLESLSLPYPPIQPVVVADFNGDGLNDLLVVTQHSVYAYVQVQHMGGLSLSSLLLTLIIALGIVYYTQLADGPVGAPGAPRPRKLRSTELD